MTDYASKALFLYAPEAEALFEKLQPNAQGCLITPQPLDAFYITPENYLAEYQHVIVSAALPAIKEVLKLSVEHNFSLGIIPLKGDKKLAIALDLPATLDESIELALRADPLPMDLVLCNGHILLFNAIIGWIPALDAMRDMSKLEVIFRALRRYGRLRLRPFTVTTAQEKSLKTVACGCMLLQRHEGDYVSNLAGVDASVRDGAIGLVVCSPFSVIGYLRFLKQVFIKSREKKSLPAGIGYIKSQAIDITTPEPMDVIIDGEKITATPVHCEALPAVARVNIGPKLEDKKTISDKETFKTNNLPDEKEAQKSIESGIPFFSYASEERFKDLFLLLNDDARINSHYIVLTLLSTLLAAVGLYLNSAAVIIGAMILAPLMAPLVSFAMGLLRGNRAMLLSSLEKLAAGVLLALFASALFSLPFTHKPVTAEMMARLNPTLLDLAVAILSGIAAA
jgi:diacylglycerol kinase family enzyme